MLLRSTTWPWKLVNQGRGREPPQGAMQVAIIEEDLVRTDKSNVPKYNRKHMKWSNNKQSLDKF